MSPGLALAGLFVLIGAQVTHLLHRGPSPYLLGLALAAAGVIAGELVAIATHVGGPHLGPLHPIADALGMLVFEVTGAVLAPARRRAP